MTQALILLIRIILYEYSVTNLERVDGFEPTHLLWEQHSTIKLFPLYMTSRIIYGVLYAPSR